MNTTATAAPAAAFVVEGVAFALITDADALYPCWEGKHGADVVQVSTTGRVYRSTIVGPFGYYKLGGGRGDTPEAAAAVALRD